MKNFQLVSQILENDVKLPLFEVYKEVLKQAWEINVDWKNKTEEENNFSDYIYSWKIFASKGIPFELWEDIAEEGLELLKKLLEDPSVPFKELPGFEEFDDRVVKRARAIRNLDNEEINYVMSEMECVVSSKFSQEQLEKWARQVKEIS
jgi:hypothetical protein